MTARAGTEEEVANLALAHVKQPKIATLTDDSSRARAVQSFFATARDAALRLRWWNFATTWVTLSAKSGATHESPLKIIYPLPADCLLVRFVQDADAEQWAVETWKDPANNDAQTPVLVSNLAAPLICYTRIVDNPKLWNADFVLAFSYLLGSLAGPQLGASVARIEFCKRAGEDYREEAAQGDAREKSNEQVTRTPSFVSARRLGGGRNYVPRN